MIIGDFGRVDREHRGKVTKRFRDRVGVVVGIDGTRCVLEMRKIKGAPGVMNVSVPIGCVEIVEMAPRDADRRMGLVEALYHALELEGTGR